MKKQKEFATQVAMLNTKIEDSDSALDSKLSALVSSTKAEVIGSLESLKDEMQTSLAENNKSLQDTQNALDTVKSEMKAALDANNGSLQTTQNALEEAKTSLKAADAALEANIGKLGASYKDVEKAIASLGERVDAIGSALSSTKNDFQTSLGTVTSKTELNDVEDKIAALKKELEEIRAAVNANGDEMKSACAAFAAIDEGVKAMEADVVALKDKFTAFNGDEARVGKEGYVFDLVMTYADFDATMEKSYAAAKASLINDAHLEEEAADALLAPVFDSIKVSWSHIMLGYLHRGTALITLGEDLAQSECYKNEYVARLNSYVLFVDFEVHKAIVKYIINTYTNTPAEATEHILGEVEKIVYIQKTADVMADTAEVMAYYNGLIAALDLWQRRAEGLNTTYGKLEEVKAAIYDLTTTYITENQQAKLIEDLEAILVNENYYNATDSEEDSDAVATLVAKDAAAMDLIVTQATTYNNVMAYAKASKDKVDALPLTADADKDTVKAAIDAAVTPLESYRLLPSDEEVAATEASDKAAFDLYVAQVSKYDELLAYLNKQIEKVNALAYLTDEEKATSDKVLSDVAIFDNYFEKLADTEAIDAQYASDVAAMDLLSFKIDSFNLAEKYAADSKAAYGNKYDDEAYKKEKELVEGYIDAVSTLNAYIYAGADEVKTVEESVNDMRAKENVKVDVLVQRLATYKAVYDLVAAADASIDAMDPKHDNAACGKAAHGIFKDKDKAAFKAKYVAFVTKYDANVDAKAFVAVDEVIAYEAEIKEAVELVVYNAATFTAIIKVVSDTEDAIDNLVKVNEINARSAATFKARFSEFATYEKHNGNTAAYADNAAFDAYKADVNTKVSDTLVIANAENQIVDCVLANKDIVAAAFDASRITKAEKNYLLKVLDEIYAARTNLAIEATDVATTNATEGKKESAEASDMAALFETIDTKTDVLNNVTIPAYLKTLKDNFYDNFYEGTYKDAETVWNKYYNDKPYGEAANLVEEPVVVDAKFAYMVTIETKVKETIFSYDIPTVFDYASFYEFKTYLAEQNLPSRLSALHHWAETNYTGGDVIDGGLFAKMTASFDALESKRLIQARDTYSKDLTEQLKKYKSTCVSKKSELNQVYNLTIGSIDVAPKTADVINFYNSGRLQFDRIRCDYELEVCYNGLLETANKNGKNAELAKAYKSLIKEIGGIMDEKALNAHLENGKKELSKVVKNKK